MEDAPVTSNSTPEDESAEVAVPQSAKVADDQLIEELAAAHRPKDRS
jgi:hypothetical protein